LGRKGIKGRKKAWNWKMTACQDQINLSKEEKRNEDEAPITNQDGVRRETSASITNRGDLRKESVSKERWEPHWSEQDKRLSNTGYGWAKRKT